LWYPIFVIFITKYLGNTTVGLLSYLVITFIIAMIATIFIEEAFLKKRKKILEKIFKIEIK
jgi:hypothetical protein